MEKNTEKVAGAPAPEGKTQAAEGSRAQAPESSAQAPEVEVFLPRVAGEAPFQYVAVNGRAWQIPRGRKYKVPAYVARVLERAQQAQEAADRFSAEEQRKMQEIQGAPV